MSDATPPTKKQLKFIKRMALTIKTDIPTLKTEKEAREWMKDNIRQYEFERALYSTMIDLEKTYKIENELRGDNK